ncbi:hypothetical protein ONE63_010289 [Megalurothrips usitatus]|uniref:Uncharacterized protein n=1 Tax=Megalurothrips usitatus TaxID=439358 RepID=A0AAV7XLI7_9NEOP|nr:hypothetical protein ONE63_010289 [Megalurothrips usitatus]
MEGKRTHCTAKPYVGCSTPLYIFVLAYCFQNIQKQCARPFRRTPLAKARSVSTLREKGDSDSGKSLLNKNSPSLLRASSNTLHTLVGKSTGIVLMGYCFLKKMNGETAIDEARVDMFDDSYNTYLRATAMTALLEKSKHKMRGDVDKQISTLQKRVNDNLDALEETKSRLNGVCLLQEQSNLLTHFNNACVSYSNEPTFTEGKSFQELLTDISRINNQLPCKNVCAPATSIELSQFQDATSKLLRALEAISTIYGSDQLAVTSAAAKLGEIKSTQDAVGVIKRSANAASHKASTNMLNEAMVKTSQLEIGD